MAHDQIVQNIYYILILFTPIPKLKDVNFGPNLFDIKLMILR